MSEEVEALRRMLRRAAHIMRRDGFTALRGTLWNDGEGVEDIQSWDLWDSVTPEDIREAIK